MKENYTELTAHQLPTHTHRPRSRKTQDVPELNQVIDIDYAKIVQNSGKTPVTKIRFIAGRWTQLDINEAGLRVFFTNAPEADHKRCIITQIIPSKSGCYAELLV